VRANWKAWVELGLGLYLVGFTVSLFFFENWFHRVSMALPFLAIFIVGYFYVAMQTFYTGWLARQSPA